MNSKQFFVSSSHFSDNPASPIEYDTTASNKIVVQHKSYTTKHTQMGDEYLQDILITSYVQNTKVQKWYVCLFI